MNIYEPRPQIRPYINQQPQPLLQANYPPPQYSTRYIPQTSEPPSNFNYNQPVGYNPNFDAQYAPANQYSNQSNYNQNYDQKPNYNQPPPNLCHDQTIQFNNRMNFDREKGRKNRLPQKFKGQRSPPKRRGFENAPISTGGDMPKKKRRNMELANLHEVLTVDMPDSTITEVSHFFTNTYLTLFKQVRYFFSKYYFSFFI